MNIRISIADDHPMVIKGVQNMLAAHPDLLLDGCYSNGRELTAGIEELLPDILLLDIQMPGETGDELAPQLLKKYPELKIIVLTNFESTLYANTMLRHGVHGYLLKNTDDESLVHAIRTVHGGARYMDPAMEEKLYQLRLDLKQAQSIYSKVTLTLREQEILQLIVNGNTSQEIVEKLYLSINTVNNYRARIFSKLDVSNMAELIRKALMLGLVK